VESKGFEVSIERGKKVCSPLIQRTQRNNAQHNCAHPARMSVDGVCRPLTVAQEVGDIPEGVRLLVCWIAKFASARIAQSARTLLMVDVQMMEMALAGGEDKA
jgi:hypothetical protein